jgi:hypothetical protein
VSFLGFHDSAFGSSRMNASSELVSEGSFGMKTHLQTRILAKKKLPNALASHGEPSPKR